MIRILFCLSLIISLQCSAYQDYEENNDTKDEATQTEEYDVIIQEEPPYEYDYEEYYGYSYLHGPSDFADDI